ncbi:hypothetical protein S101395_02040 [Bacillus sonorensis]|uniref:Uncharacterized protein n=1 Tax=Bacillus sonorensis TaxID=119858 RepID=A0ABM6LHT2_9BACI|nr:hypothetical protein S101395_02040 [Bacillus sonorensis]TWK76018.1 hypothetical protein CHCC20335_3783 [Bacillus paralicheniformis]
MNQKEMVFSAIFLFQPRNRYNNKEAWYKTESLVLVVKT